MILPDEVIHSLLDRYGASIATTAAAAFEAMLQDIRSGTAPRDAIATAQQGFDAQFLEQLAAAFSELLRAAVGIAEVRTMRVGGLTLSRWLYDNSRQVQADALSVIRAHAQGVQQARDLALQLYDGYVPPGAPDGPLGGMVRGQLPAPLRLLVGDKAAADELQAVFSQGRFYAAGLKSPALRAAYLEAFDAWAGGAAEDVLTRKLVAAVREKNRFMANRIAQTELARAHQLQVAQKLMADDGVEVVQVLINRAGHVLDVCDLHATADLFGLGPGCYPKARAPLPPFHPFCRCTLRARWSLSGVPARNGTGAAAARAYIASLSPSAQGRVIGSKAKARAFLEGAGLDGLLNDGAPAMYTLQRLGDLRPA